MSLKLKKFQVKREIKELEKEYDRVLKIERSIVSDYGSELAGDCFDESKRIYRRLAMLKKSLYVK